MKHRAFRPLFLAVAFFGAAACSEESVGPGDGDTAPPETRSVEGVTTAVAAIIGTFADGPLDQPYLLESMAEFDTHYGGVDPHHEASYHVRAFFDNGGERIWVTRVGNADAGGLLGSRVAGTGLFALEEANRFDLLLVPEIFTSDDIVDRAFVASEAVRYASERAAMALLDPPAEVLSARDVIDWMGKAGAVLRHPH
ncbi:MAG TPA: hypothetical protein VK966_03735, partial [Longimicrobiales bacterium]|nr:hypothetical protein [Longimicrobiales bacterium]